MSSWSLGGIAGSVVIDGLFGMVQKLWRGKFVWVIDNHVPSTMGDGIHDGPELWIRRHLSALNVYLVAQLRC